MGVVYVDVWILCVNCEALDYQSDLIIIGSLENLFSPFGTQLRSSQMAKSGDCVYISTYHRH